ncbi:MAG: HlyD family efflux transporter periplasmic adaptor subunit [Bacteroidota bacterium]
MNRLILFIPVILMAACSSNESESDAYGNFEATEILVAPEVAGRVLFFRAAEGEIMQKGDTVCIIDTIPIYLKKKQALAQRKAVSTKINHVIAQISVLKEQKTKLIFEKERLERLFKDGAATQKQLDDISSQIEIINKQISAIEVQNSTTLSELEVLDTQIAQINDQINRSVIINPVNGNLLEQYIEPSEIAIPGKALYKIADMSEMELRIYVSGKQLPNIRTGQQVEVLTDDYEKASKTFRGTISWISEQAEFTPKIIQTKEERVNLVYAVKVRVKNDGTLKIGMPGEVNFKINESID